MRKYFETFVTRQWLAMCCAVALAFSPAIAQVFTAPNNFTLGGHYIASGNPPTGTGCTIAAGSTDTDGSCTASAGSGSIAFAVAYLTAPNCLVADSSATPLAVYTTTTTQITLTTVTSTHVLFWHCAAKIGG